MLSNFSILSNASNFYISDLETNSNGGILIVVLSIVGLCICGICCYFKTPYPANS